MVNSRGSEDEEEEEDPDLAKIKKVQRFSADGCAGNILYLS